MSEVWVRFPTSMITKGRVGYNETIFELTFSSPTDLVEAFDQRPVCGPGQQVCLAWDIQRVVDSDGEFWNGGICRQITTTRIVVQVREAYEVIRRWELGEASERALWRIGATWLPDRAREVADDE